ncbi:MAG: DNA repair protein RadA [bacterium]|nr:DNA repair protein RadA [bacterium]
MAFFICSNCGEGSASWMGRCPNCSEWNTLVQKRESKTTKSKKTEVFESKAFKTIVALDTNRNKTDVYELDRVLGGGVVKGEVILLTGEPGVGKSTLLLQTLHKLTTLYISGEESPEQIKDRADRLAIPLTTLSFSDSLQVEAIDAGVRDMKTFPDIIVIDSIQTIYSKDVPTAPGSITQLREATARLIRLSKETGVPMIIVGHVTKDGDIAGPKSLEHMVDAVLHFEGEKVSNYRILRAQKNRFGSTDEIGIFEMTPKGLKEVDNPTVFLDKQEVDVPGKSIAGVMEGQRPLFFEIQALATRSFLAVPRRVVKGLDYNKILLLIAVIQKHLNIDLNTYDLYLNVIGGVQVKSPAADLAVVAAILSTVKDIPLSARTIFTGELGLLGEIRKVYGEERIVQEAKRLKFTKQYYSMECKSVKELYKKISN